jgi:hypothetical protein
VITGERIDRRFGLIVASVINGASVVKQWFWGAILAKVTSVPILTKMMSQWI